jgi:membrane protease YdiL (CAAX protease family)
MTLWDHLLVLAFAIGWPAHGLLAYRSYLESVRRGVPGTRLAEYATAMLTQWLFVAAMAALWIHLDRDFTALGLVAPATVAAWGALGVSAGIGGLMVAQSAMVARHPETHEQARHALSTVAELLPRDRNDLSGFVALSITAGICEEILFRGLLPWYLAPLAGVWGGQGLALIVFTTAHLYLGVTASLRAGLAGAACAGLYLWSGSLVPGMLLHAALDVAAGWMAYEVLRERAPAAA